MINTEKKRVITMNKLLAIVLAGAMALSCGACAGSDSGESNPTESTAPGVSSVPAESTVPTEPSAAPTQPSLPVQDTVQEWTLCGLTYTLIGSYEILSEEDCSIVHQGSNISVDVSFGALDQVDERVDSSESFARYMYHRVDDLFSEEFTQITMERRGDVSYLLCQGGETVRTIVWGFYVCGDVGWTIGVNGYEPDLDLEQMITMAVSGVIDVGAVPEPSVPNDPDADPTTPTEDDETDPRLPEPGNDITFRGLTLHMSQTGVPTFVDDSVLRFTCGDLNYRISSGSVAELDTPAASGDELAGWYQKLYEGSWDTVTISACNGNSYVMGRDEDGFTLVLGCYVSGGNWWLVETMAFMEDTLAAVEIVTCGSVG